MTLPSSIRAFVVPLAGAVATAAVFTAALWIQHARDAWPFSPDATLTSGVVPLSDSSAPSPMGTAAAHDRVPVDLQRGVVDDLGIRLETVGREALSRQVRAVATIVPDESRISHVHTRVAGWIEQLDVNTTGQIVRAGQPLARIFSQELLSSQTEYLAARRHATTTGITSVVVASGRTRLTVLGMSPEEIDHIEQTGEPSRLVTVVAPRSGVVVNRGVTVGTAVDPSTTLVTIADLSRVWVFAEVPEAHVPGIGARTAAELEFPGSGLEAVRSRVEFVYPMLSERTRTLRVRFSVVNRGGALRPGLYGTAVFESVGTPVMTVPRDAVVDTGLVQHVFVATGDTYEPRPVSLGVQLADRVEVRSGLREGEQVVAAGVFLLDSESRLRATGAGGHGHGRPKQAQDAPAAPHAEHRE